MHEGVLVILVSVIGYSLVAKRAANSVITAPMVFLLVGLLLAYTKLFRADEAEHMLHLVAEVSLIILLFLDAAKTDLQALIKEHILPQRMLLVGLPLAIVLGLIFAIPLFPEFPLPVLALMAAIMAPTDAALGQAVVTNDQVPEQDRRTLTVESGLNDGLALPIIVFFSCMVAGLEAPPGQSFSWLGFAAAQVIVGPLLGLTVGWLGAKMFLFAESRDLTSPTFEGIAVLALAGTAYLAATLAFGNGFIAAFSAGLAFGHLVKSHCSFIFEFTESEGQMLVWASFLFIGLGLLPEALDNLTIEMAIYILLSLFIVRPLAIYISLLGTNTKVVTRIFFGWFGPRGLATALFALLVSQEIGHDYAHSVIVLAINAVWISALLHGLSAVPAANWYAKKVSQ